MKDSIQRRRSVSRSRDTNPSRSLSSEYPSNILLKRQSSDLSLSNRTNENKLKLPGNNKLKINQDFEKKILFERRAKMRYSGRSIASIKSFPFGATNLGTGISVITNNILLGGRDEAADEALLLSWGVTHVLNVAQQLPNYHENSFIYLKIPLLDHPDTVCGDSMHLATPFLQRVESLNGRVLVHCISGVSRSVTVLLLYLIAQHDFDLKTIYDYVKACRPFIFPNEGFRKEMALWELKHRGCSSVAKNAGSEWEFYALNAIKRSFPQLGVPYSSSSTTSSFSSALTFAPSDPSDSSSLTSSSSLSLFSSPSPISPSSPSSRACVVS